MNSWQHAVLIVLLTAAYIGLHNWMAARLARWIDELRQLEDDGGATGT